MLRTLALLALLGGTLLFAAGATPAIGQQYGASDSDAYARAFKNGYRDDSSKTSGNYQPDYVSHGEYRQPRSIVLLDSKHALVTTKLTGEIYQLDLNDLSVSVVVNQRRRQFDQVIRIDENRIAVADTQLDQVVIFRNDDASKKWIEVACLDLPGRPNSLCYAPIEKELWVSSVWGQRLFRFRLPVEGETPSLIHSIDLPMCGGQVLYLPKRGVVLVTDAFGCDFVVINEATGEIINHDQLYEHNICQLTAIDGGEVVVFPQQLLNELTAALQTDITWGNFLSNNLRWLKTEKLVSSSGADIYSGSRFVPIGSVGNGAGDPTSMAISRDDQIAITVGGTNQVALGSLQGRRFQFVDVGMHPIDCLFTDDGSRLVVVNQFSDSICVIDSETFEVKNQSLGPVRAPTDVERGEQLFHDSTLSHDGWMSCQSCHSQGHTNGLLTDNFTDHSYRSPKRVLSLLGQANTAPYSWAGTMETMEEQIAFSIHSTMASDEEVRDDDVDCLAKYVRTLSRPPSLAQARSTGGDQVRQTIDIKRGRKFFKSAGCVDCHATPLYTSEETYDVGLQDERALREFNPPSLIAVSQRQNSLLHDGRAKSIRDVVVKERHQMPDEVTDRQQTDLMEYLKSL